MVIFIVTFNENVVHGPCPYLLMVFDLIDIIVRQLKIILVTFFRKDSPNEM